MRILFFLLTVLINTTFGAYAEKPRLVVTFSILHDIVKNVAGDGYDVDYIVPLGSDPHVYEIKPGDIKKIIKPGDKDAAVAVFLIGLGFEGNLKCIIEHSKYGGRVVEVTAPQSDTGRKVKTRLLVDADKPATDPHVWGSAANVIIMVENIRDALIKISPKDEKTIRSNASAYIKQLKQLQRYIVDSMAKIPANRRKVVTTHDAFYYYGEAYGIEFLAPIGTSTESEPSARDMSKIIDLVKQEGIRAIFFENIANVKHIKQIAEETGVKLDPDKDILYADSLSGPAGPAGSYIKMMQHNTMLILSKLQ